MNKKKDEFISPLDFFDETDSQTPEKPVPARISKPRRERRPSRSQEKKIPAAGKQGRAIFVTGTDTGVGKTTIVKVLATLLKDRGLNVGVMKPVQCGGEDAKSLKEFLQLTDPLEDINPYFAKDPFSPHIAFQRERVQVHRDKILSVFQKLRNKHDILLVEGAGGFMVPIKPDYLVADLVKDMGAELVIVSRTALGTINHTLLTIDKARDLGIAVLGIIYSQSEKKVPGVPEKTNPATIKNISHTRGLGIIPFLEDISPEAILKNCRNKIDLKAFLTKPSGPDTARLISDDKNHVWHPFTQMKDWLAGEPLVIDRVEGNYLIDTEGRRYLDGVASLWVNVHGHCHPAIIKAVKDQVNRLDHSTFLGLTHAPAVALAKKLVRLAPQGLEKVFYSDNGSTSVEVAVKMACQYWQNTGRKEKTKFVHFANSYHGDTLGSVSVGGIGLFHDMYRNLIFPTIAVPSPDGYRDMDFEKSITDLERILSDAGNTVAAVVVEPLVQGAAGMIVWPDGVLKRIKDLCEKHEVFLIADEVATGFGRTGKMFACEHENVTPDFLCLAKGLSGGVLPLAATLTTKKVFDGFVFDYKDQKTFFHGHTYTANPVACAAALANLEIFETEHTLSRLGAKINLMSEKLKMFYNLASVGQVRQKGFMAGIELVKNKESKEPFAWEEKAGIKVCEKARERGVILRPLGNVIVIMPPLAIEKRELDYLLNVTQWAISKL